MPDAAWQYATKAAYTSASAAQSRTAATCTQPWCSETMQSGVDNTMAMLLAARGLGGNEQKTTSLPVERSRRNNKSSPPPQALEERFRCAGRDAGGGLTCMPAQYHALSLANILGRGQSHRFACCIALHH